MTYRATNESSTLTPEGRCAEARHIYEDLGLSDHLDDMTPNARSMVTQVAEEGFTSVSIKQLFWFRDLKDQLCP